MTIIYLIYTSIIQLGAQANVHSIPSSNFPPEQLPCVIAGLWENDSLRFYNLGWVRTFIHPFLVQHLYHFITLTLTLMVRGSFSKPLYYRTVLTFSQLFGGCSIRNKVKLLYLTCATPHIWHQRISITATTFIAAFWITAVSVTASIHNHALINI